MNKIIALATVAAASFAVPAFAQEDVRPAFTGPYVAGLVGYDNVRAELPGVGKGNEDGLLYGGVVGYDVNIGGAVFGIEGEYSDSNTKAAAEDVLFLGDELSIRSGRDLYAGIRIGGEIAPNILLYGKGGYTNAKVKAVYDDGIDAFSSSEKLEGYRLGAGVETTVSGFTGRLEYRYSSYGKLEGTDVDFQRHQVALLVGYRF